MSNFTSPLVVEHLDGRNWRVAEPFSWRIGTKETGCDLTVPEGFVTDFASVPRPFWSWLSPTGRFGKAAVLHDWLYQTRPVSRLVADAVFLEAMQALDVSPVKRLTIYLAVRVFGWRYMKKRSCKYN